MINADTKQDGTRKMPREDLIALYKDFEIESLRKVYQDEYVPNLRMADLITEFRRQARKRSFERNAVYQAIMREIDAFNDHLCTLINDARCESLASNALRHLRVPGYVLENVCLEYDGETVEIDELVLSNKKIFMVETKFYTTDVVIDEHGVISGRNGCRHDRYNVIDRICDREFVLEGILSPIVGVTDLYKGIESVLCFANNNADFDDQLGMYKTCRCADLPLVIEGADGEDIFTMDQLDAMHAAIEEQRVEAAYPAEYDLEILSGCVDYVLDLIAEYEPDEAYPVSFANSHEPAHVFGMDVEPDKELDWPGLVCAASAAAAFAVGVACKSEDLRNAIGLMRL